MQKDDHIDPKGLIRESYRIEGIKPEECRSIFFDWALGVPMDGDHTAMITTLLERHAKGREDHPMTAVLRAGLNDVAQKKRRGGRSGRFRN